MEPAGADQLLVVRERLNCRLARWHGVEAPEVKNSPRRLPRDEAAKRFRVSRVALLRRNESTVSARLFEPRCQKARAPAAIREKHPLAVGQLRHARRRSGDPAAPVSQALVVSSRPFAFEQGTFQTQPFDADRQSPFEVVDVHVAFKYFLACAVGPELDAGGPHAGDRNRARNTKGANFCREVKTALKFFGQGRGQNPAASVEEGRVDVEGARGFCIVGRKLNAPQRLAVAPPDAFDRLELPVYLDAVRTQPLVELRAGKLRRATRLHALRHDSLLRLSAGGCGLLGSPQTHPAEVFQATQVREVAQDEFRLRPEVEQAGNLVDADSVQPLDPREAALRRPD